MQDMKTKRMLLSVISAVMCALCSWAGANVTVGAARTNLYVPLLKGKRVALLSNQTGMVGKKHVLDVMLEHGLNVVTIFSPEHGFRGKADAGEKVGSSVDGKTGIPIASLYDGKSPMPSKRVMDGIDVIVVDIQDVGLRFYTYYVTMINLMDAAITYNKEFMVLDRVWHDHGRAGAHGKRRGVAQRRQACETAHGDSVCRLHSPHALSPAHSSVAQSAKHAGSVSVSVAVLL